MFIGMALRMAQEIGLHRERPSRGRSIGQSPTNFASGDLASPKLPLELTSDHNVEIEEFEKSAQVVLFWCVYTMDVNICNGTGRVPTMKRHEISIRLPEDRDIAVIRAGPGVSMKSLKPEVYPQYAKMMLLYAKSIDFLNTSSSQVQGESLLDDVARKDRLVALKAELMESYRKIPREIRFGAIYYQAAVKSSQASPYLLLHLQYHLQIAFLSQESMAGDDVTTEPLEGTVTEDGRLNLPVDRHQEDSDKRKTDEQLYRSSIRSITDMLTFAKHIDDRALMSTFWMNQSFFHAACAYVRDMLQQRGDFPTVRDSKPVTFPIPNQTAPSLVDPFQDYSRYPEHLIPRTASSVAAESTTTYLALIAKANYQFLREAIRVVAQYYSGAGWVDAVLDQREAGLRDVDLSIVSDNISSYIRLHDLKSRTHSSNTTSKASSRQLNGNLALNNADISQKLPPLPPRTGSLPTMSSDDYSAAWADLASGFMTDNEMNWEFDPQAFFNDYMFAGKPLFARCSCSFWLMQVIELANQRASALQSPS